MANKAKEYSVTIQSNMTCPQKATVMGLVENKAANFKTVIGSTPKMGKYPVFVDEEKPEAQYGLIHKVTLGEETITNDKLLQMIENGANIMLDTAAGNFIYGRMVLDEVKQANVDETVISPKLQAIIDEKIAAGIVTKEDMDRRLKVMQINKVDEALKIKVVKGYRKYAKAPHEPRCIYVDPEISKIKPGREGIIAEGLRNAVNRMAAICEGEKSVGKNVYMETIAWLLGMPLYMITFSRQMSPSHIYGDKSTDNSASEMLKNMHREATAKVMLESKCVRAEDVSKAIDAAAQFEIMKARAASVSIVIDQSELYDWLVDGGCMVLNELNMGESNFLSSFLNPLTDGTGFLFIPGRGEVKMHEDCVLFGTQNADYEGVMQQNEATVSRFNTLYFKQPESVVGQFKAATEAALKKSGCTYKLKSDYYNQAQAFYTYCLKSVRSSAISNAVLNIRGFVRALTTVAESEGYCSLNRWIQICVIDTCPTDERQGLKDALNSIVQL